MYAVDGNEPVPPCPGPCIVCVGLRPWSGLYIQHNEQMALGFNFLWLLQQNTVGRMLWTLKMCPVIILGSSVQDLGTSGFGFWWDLCSVHIGLDMNSPHPGEMPVLSPDSSCSDCSRQALTHGFGEVVRSKGGSRQ